MGDLGVFFASVLTTTAMEPVAVELQEGGHKRPPSVRCPLDGLFHPVHFAPDVDQTDVYSKSAYPTSDHDNLIGRLLVPRQSCIGELPFRHSFRLWPYFFRQYITFRSIPCPNARRHFPTGFRS